MDVNGRPPGYAQTLGNGLRVLDILRGHPQGLGVNAIAVELGAHRTVVYRLLATLRAHGLVTRDTDGRHRLGISLLGLAAAVRTDLRSTAASPLSELAETVGATAFLTLAEGNEAMTVSVVEPRNARMHVAYRLGSRHPLTVGAPGLAILAGRPHLDGERAEVTTARAAGYAITVSELESGAWGLAMPLVDEAGWAIASAGVVALTELDLDRVVLAVRRALSVIAGGNTDTAHNSSGADDRAYQG